MNTLTDIYHWLAAANSGEWIVLLTAGLLIVGWFTVREMTKTRAAQVYPRLAMDFWREGGPGAFLEISNVGLGAALNANLTLTFYPADPNKSPIRQELRVDIFHKAERRIYAPPEDAQDLVYFENFARAYKKIVLTGTMEDAFGKSIEVNETVENLSGYYKARQSAQQLYSDSDLKKTEKHIDEISRSLKDIEKHLQLHTATARQVLHEKIIWSRRLKKARPKLWKFLIKKIF